MTTSSWWVNGIKVVPVKTDGYLPLTLRLDDISGVKLRYGDEGENVLAVWTNNAATTGWWYEGSGLVRHARIVAAPVAAWLPPFAVTTPHSVIGPTTSRTAAAEGIPTPSIHVRDRGSVVARRSKA